jgi:CheY-like chemotaxis protein
VPALALTALASDADRVRALSAGFQMHVAKPVDGLTLTRAVAELSRAASLPPVSTLRYRQAASPPCEP